MKTATGLEQQRAKALVFGKSVKVEQKLEELLWALINDCDLGSTPFFIVLSPV